MDTNHPYYKALEPRSTFELFRWILQEPLRVWKYSYECKRKEAIVWILKVYFSCVLPLTIFLWFLLMNGIVFFDGPTLLEATDNEYFIENWKVNNYLGRLQITINSTYIGLGVGLAYGLGVGLAFGLAAGLAYGLGVGLAFGLAGGLAFGLSGGLGVGLTYGLAYGLGVGLAYRLTFGLALGLTLGLASGLALGLLGGLVGELALGLPLGLGLTIGWYIAYFGIFDYPIYNMKSAGNVSFLKNPYISCQTTRLPIWGMTQKMTTSAQKTPKAAEDFVNFAHFNEN